MAGAHAEFRSEDLALTARMIGNTNALQIVTGAETGIGVLGGKWLELASLQAFPQVARYHGHGVLQQTYTLGLVKDVSRLALMEIGHTVAGAESIGGVLRLEGFEGNSVQTACVITGRYHTSSCTLLVNMFIRTIDEGGNADILAAAISTGRIHCRKSGIHNGATVASSVIAQAGGTDLGGARKAGTQDTVIGLAI